MPIDPATAELAQTPRRASSNPAVAVAGRTRVERFARYSGQHRAERRALAGTVRSVCPLGPLLLLQAGGYAVHSERRTETISTELAELLNESGLFFCIIRKFCTCARWLHTVGWILGEI